MDLLSWVLQIDYTTTCFTVCLSICSLIKSSANTIFLKLGKNIFPFFFNIFFPNLLNSVCKKNFFWTRLCSFEGLFYKNRPLKITIRGIRLLINLIIRQSTPKHSTLVQVEAAKTLAAAVLGNSGNVKQVIPLIMIMLLKMATIMTMIMENIQLWYKKQDTKS